MNGLLFSDLHTSNKNLVNLEKLSLTDGIDFLIFTGDVVNMGEPVSFVDQFIRAIKKINKPFFWVPGNNDFGRGYYKLRASYPSLEGKVVEMKLKNIISKHPERPEEVEGSSTIKITGVGGSPASWSGQYAGETMVDRKKIGGSIFVSHFPPPGVRTYIKFDDGFSPTVNKKFSDSPLVHICGHLHHRWGISYLGTTKVIQLAALELGYYAIMNLKTLKVEFKRFK